MIPIANEESMRGLGDLLSSIRKIRPAKVNGNKKIITQIP
jgi:hypothetical protein